VLDQLERIGLELNAVAASQRAMADAQAKYLADSQAIEQRRQLGELSAAQAATEQQRVEREHMAAQHAATLEAIARTKASFNAARDALENPQGSKDLIEAAGVPTLVAGAFTVAHELYRNWTRKRALAAVNGGAA